MKDQRDLARGWFAKAESDLSSARGVVAGKGPYDTACFHAQQAAEKYIKGFLAFHRVSFPFVHYLEKLTPLCEAIQPTLKLATPEIIGLTDYAVQLRYDPDFWPTQQKAAEALAVAERVRAMILAVMPAETHPQVTNTGSKP